MNAPVEAAVEPIAGGLARYVLKPVPETVDDALNVVNAPGPGVVLPSETLLMVPPVIAAPFASVTSPVARFIISGVKRSAPESA